MNNSEAGAAPRAAAARAVCAVMDAGRSLDRVLAEIQIGLTANDRALVAAMAHGVMREYRALDAILAPRLKRTPQPLLHALLLVGIYQLEHMRVPSHAAVHASVAASRSLGYGKARGLVNAVLRGHQRDRPPRASEEPGVRYSHPDWLIAAIRADWPACWERVLEANNARAPMHLRVNTRVMQRDDYIERLARNGIEAEPMGDNTAGLTLAVPVPTSTLPGFDTGMVSIQDGAAQIAAGLLAPLDGNHVLDACAAPGNKSAHLLESAQIDLLALDIDAERTATLDQTLSRLGLEARTAVGDALDTTAWWDGRVFDRILLDAPCSGTGVIRRHPDIKWLRRAADIGVAAERQGALLDALWPTLAPGGRLVYATCSLLRAEGADVVSAFLARQAGARERPIEAVWGEGETVGRRIAPGCSGGLDGFYYAVLERDDDAA